MGGGVISEQRRTKSIFSDATLQETLPGTTGVIGTQSLQLLYFAVKKAHESITQVLDDLCRRHTVYEASRHSTEQDVSLQS